MIAALKLALKTRSKNLYQVVDLKCLGIPTILVKTVEGFVETRAMESAASMAYYALFSFFPLIIFVVGAVSSVLEDEPVQQMVLDIVGLYLPVALNFVQENIKHAVDTSGTVQLAGTIGLLWAATGVFTALAHSIDRAWHTAPERNFVWGRLVALAMVASLTGLLIVWVLFKTVFSLLPLFEIGDIKVYETNTWLISANILPWFAIFVLFVNIYRWVPNTKVRWREAIIGAICAALAWEFANAAFSWYLSSAWGRYQLIYGSLGALVGFMLWIYVGNAIILFGAHLCANIAWHTRSK